MKINRKKSILYGVAIIAIAAVAAWNVSLGSKHEKDLSYFALKNVEALSQEGGGGGGAYVTCKCGDNRGVCSANNIGSACAGGNNVQCSSYDGNCR
jgi:hypothetical protein